MAQTIHPRCPLSLSLERAEIVCVTGISRITSYKLVLLPEIRHIGSMIKWCCGIILIAAVASSQAEQKAGLSEAEQVQLQRDKILITNNTYRQIFSAYVFNNEPVFITSDSVLNAWQVLYGDTLQRLEEQFSWDLSADLDHALRELPKEAPEGIPKEVFASALKRSILVLGTASRLMGGAWSGGREIDEAIAEEVREIEDANRVSLPGWLNKEGTDLLGIDHAVFRPSGIYADSDHLQRYFRAVRWLQTVPFDPKRDDQSTAMLLIMKSLGQSSSVSRISQLYAPIMGEATTADLALLERQLSREEHPSLNQLRSALNELQELVVLSSRTLPDLRMFESTTSILRPFPSSMEIGSLLGSSLASESLKGEPSMIGQIDKCRGELNEHGSLYEFHLSCLAQLFAPPEPEAPAFMKTEAWQRKSLNSALGGWAQLRHAWGLQGQEFVKSFGMIGGPRPVGFVEPNPEFFRKFSKLIALTQSRLGQADTNSGHAVKLPRRAAELIPMVRDLIEPMKQWKIAQDGQKEPTPVELEAFRKRCRPTWERVRFFLPVVEGGGVRISGSGGSPDFTPDFSIDDPERLIQTLQKIADGENLASLEERLNMERPKADEEKRWLDLLGICHELETLGHKQLRGIELADDEVEFIKTYASRLGRVMLYTADSWMSPKDDAPRITSVFNRPGEGFLLAGIGRPREIRVLYPWKGKEIECRGAVMPFLEMRSERHLTDVEFKALLDTPERPRSPEWLRPISSEKP